MSLILVTNVFCNAFIVQGEILHWFRKPTLRGQVRIGVWKGQQSKIGFRRVEWYTPTMAKIFKELSLVPSFHSSLDNLRSK